MKITKAFLEQELTGLEQQEAQLLAIQRDANNNVAIINGAIQTTREYLKALDKPEPEPEAETPEDDIGSLNPDGRDEP